LHPQPKALSLLPKESDQSVKFKELIKTGDETQKKLDLISNRFNSGIGLGKKYVQQQM
jgi:hypothetical protein